MIIVGYQGIGKSTLANNKKNNYIDLESGNFYVNGTRPLEWDKIYSKIALSLSRQGYKVFTSSHASIRKDLAEDKEEEKIIIYPSLGLKTEWVERLRKRWTTTLLDKDYRAYINAMNSYENNIKDLQNQEGFGKIELTSMDYNLDKEITKFLQNLQIKLKDNLL